MKTRVDFVSNSSSSSFVVACQKQYLDDVIKDLSRACCSGSRKYNKDLKKRNSTILDFCLHTFQLAFLGELLLETKKTEYSLEAFKKMWTDPSDNSRPDRDDDFYKKEWKHYKADLEKIRLGKRINPWVKRDYELDTYDPVTDTAIHYDKVYVKDVVVSNETMEYGLHRYHFNGTNTSTPEETKQRVDALVHLAKEKNRDGWNKVSAYCNPNVYQITEDTIANTRDLIASGWKVELDKWQDLDKLEAKLKGGDVLFYVRIAHSGDGYGDFYIYCEDEADGIDGISGIEILTSDSL